MRNRWVHEAYPESGWYNMYRGTLSLPPGVRDWDVVVLAEVDVPSFPEPLGPLLGRVWIHHVYARR